MRLLGSLMFASALAFTSVSMLPTTVQAKKKMERKCDPAGKQCKSGKDCKPTNCKKEEAPAKPAPEQPAPQE